MTPILTWLWIGRYRDTTDLHTLRAFGIGAMLQLAEHVPQPGIETLYLEIEDGQPVPAEAFARGIGFVEGVQQKSCTVMISCGAGQSRSVAFTVGVLHRLQGLAPVAALGLIRDKHPRAMPHPVVWRSLCQYLGHPYDRRDLV